MADASCMARSSQEALFDAARCDLRQPYASALPLNVRPASLNTGGFTRAALHGSVKLEMRLAFSKAVSIRSIGAANATTSGRKPYDRHILARSRNLATNIAKPNKFFSPSRSFKTDVCH